MIISVVQVEIKVISNYSDFHGAIHRASFSRGNDTVMETGVGAGYSKIRKRNLQRVSSHQ